MAAAASEIDIEQPDQLIAYLRATNRIAADETPICQTLAGGVSNRTVLVTRPSGEAWVLKQALAKLRVKVDWFSDPARIHREALGLTWLAKLVPPAWPGTITPLIFEDADQHLLAMEAVPQPHENWKTMLLSRRGHMPHVSRFAMLLAAIHTRSASSASLREIFDDRTFFETLRIEPYYAYTAEQVPEAREFMHQLIADTRGRRSALVHGDYSPKNVLIQEKRFVLLDHEVIHWGDPMFDVGFALTHLLSKAHQLRYGFFIQAAWWFTRDYRRDAPMDEEFAAKHTLACMLARVAGRSQLEYLDDTKRSRQREWMISKIRKRLSVDEVIHEAQELYAHH